MPKGYRHLTHPERCQIHATRKSRLSNGAIARQLGRDRTTASLCRNPGKRGYRHAQAQRRGASLVPGRMTPELWALVEERLVPAASNDLTTS